MKLAPWFMRFEDRPSCAVRILCCPFAGGGASSFAEWSRGLDPRFELLALQLPARENRILEAPCETMDAIIAGVLDRVPLLLDKPYVVYGHSMGASIGFELVRGLLERGLTPPLHLFASGSPAPHLPRSRPPISHLPDARFLQELREYGGMPQQILEHSELLELYLPMLRADFKIVEGYRAARTRVHLPISASIYGGAGDSTVKASDLHAWRSVADVVKVELFPGGHFFIKDHYRRILSDIAAVAFAPPTEVRRAQAGK
jgi:medium-chain acyl-[acyl-carrier-protein] hydrolase